MAKVNACVLAVLLGVVSSVTSACLQKDITETWFLDAGTGAMTWSVFEDHVRLDVESAADRDAEEQEYIDSAKRQDHPVARGLRELGLGNPRTRVIRDVVPFSVFTDVDAGRIDILGERMIRQFGLTGTSVLARNGTIWEWTWTSRDSGRHDDGRDQTGADALGEGFRSLVVMIQNGRFENATGFDLSADRRAAKRRDLDGAAGPEPSHGTEAPTVLRLRWTSSVP